MAVKWGWANKLEAALDYCPPEQKIVAMETKDGVSIRLQIEAHDTLACSFTQLRIEQGQAVDREIDIQAWAEDIIRRVNYLPEPLRVIEADRDGAAQLRSDPPEKRDGAVVYYDVILSARYGQPMSVDFRRYSKSEQKVSRAVVPCILTLDILKRLVSDFEAAWPNRPAVAEAEKAEQWSPLA